ncbi:MAG: hypothetical protein HC850_10130, partial [Rhodomicrobium sp.]|nr:hypothetical protein [Rhodomicrobium sp.]
TAEALVKNARGEAKIAFPKGGQMQLNVPQLVKSASSQGREGWDSASLAWSKFDNLRVQLSLRDGSLRCEGLLLSSAEAQMRGAGEVDLDRRNLNLTVSVSQGEAGSGEGERQGADSGFNRGASVSIKGPWARPEIRLGERAGENAGHKWLGAEAPNPL